jgi:hypothetical protein
MNEFSRHVAGCHAIGGRRPSRDALLALLVSAAIVGGCGGGSPAAVSAVQPTVPPPTTGSTGTATALSLYESVVVHAELTSSALSYAAPNFQVWTIDYCVFGGGSLQATLDGAPATIGLLPAGNHTFSVTFTNCLVDGLLGASLNGAATAAYTRADPGEDTAFVSTSSMRGTQLAFRSGLHDATAYGSATLTGGLTDAGVPTTIYTPTAGSTLVNNLTGNTATFAGGSYSSAQLPPPPDSSASVEQYYDNLVIAIDGSEYTIDGNLKSVYGFVGNEGVHTGEIRITSKGILVARIYGDANGRFSVDASSTLPPF